MTAPQVLVLGASGRLGSILRRHWTDPARLRPLWQIRTGRHGTIGPDILCFDPLDPGSCAYSHPVDLVLDLAGVVPGKGDVGLNAALGCAAVALGARLGAKRVLLASSAAVYGGAAGLLCEAHPPSPVHPYGIAKLAMEDAAHRLGAALGVPVTALRIGNVAGADALLGQEGSGRVLDRFADGLGPRRSYIGPGGLAALLKSLMRHAATGTPLPGCLNVALDGGVDMADLCAAAGLAVEWRPAPPTALPSVVLDIGRLGGLLPVPRACPEAIIRDWRQDGHLAQARAHP